MRMTSLTLPRTCAALPLRFHLAPLAGRAQAAFGGRSLETPKRSFGYARSDRVRGSLRESDSHHPCGRTPHPTPLPVKNGERERTSRASILIRLFRAGFLTLILALTLPASGARAQSLPSRDDIVSQLNRFESAPEIDLVALRQQAMERAKARLRNDPGPVNRPPIAPGLADLPNIAFPIQFDDDTPIIEPESYETVGRIADALVHASTLPYTFLIVGHVESNGKRETNVTLSQRRADAIRDVLVNMFKISAKRIRAIGLGEEQFLDRAHPTAAVNGQMQILTLAKLPDEQPDQADTSPPQPAKRQPKRH